MFPIRPYIVGIGRVCNCSASDEELSDYMKGQRATADIIVTLGATLPANDTWNMFGADTSQPDLSLAARTAPMTSGKSRPSRDIQSGNGK